MALAPKRQAGAQDADLLQRQRLLVHARDLLSQALREEEMPQGGAFHLMSPEMARNSSLKVYILAISVLEMLLITVY